jgi:hypothetical protein
VPSKRKVDTGFWNRADAHIHLANEQCNDIGAGKVSASLLYAASRFNAFIVASQAADAAGLRATKQEALEYFTDEFRKMLDENLDDYIKHHKKYVGGKQGDA